MSDELTTLIVSLVMGMLVFGIAMLIRIRGPVGLVKQVDWSRVSDPQGLGQFVSLILTLMSALIAAHGALIYAFHADRSSRNIGTVVFVVLITALVLALLIGQQRYQDKPRSKMQCTDGRR
jgi:hypothetical protein